MNTRELAVVMGPPGGAKTAFAVSVSIIVARVVPVLYVSTELEQHELMARLAANLTGRPWSAIRRGGVPQAEIDQALAGVDVHLLGSDVLPVDGAGALKLIDREIAALVRGGTPPLVVVDYMQELARGGNDREVRGRVGDIATELRRMSQRHDCPVLAVSSVARQFYDRKKNEFRETDDPTVYLAAAKESGDVDYAAARVMFLDAEDDRTSDERAVRIAVAKSRDAEVGFAGARVVSATGRFLAAPDAVRALSSPGRATAAASTKLDDADEAVLASVTKAWSKGQGELCTKTNLREGCGIGSPRVGPALDRLVHLRKLEIAEVERTEGTKVKRRQVYRPVGLPVPSAPQAPAQLEIGGDHAQA